VTRAARGACTFVAFAIGFACSVPPARGRLWSRAVARCVAVGRTPDRRGGRPNKQSTAPTMSARFGLYVAGLWPPPRLSYVARVGKERGAAVEGGEDAFVIADGVCVLEEPADDGHGERGQFAGGGRIDAVGDEAVLESR
jgi:hypothetical protein